MGLKTQLSVIVTTGKTYLFSLKDYYYFCQLLSWWPQTFIISVLPPYSQVVFFTLWSWSNSGWRTELIYWSEGCITAAPHQPFWSPYTHCFGKTKLQTRQLVTPWHAALGRSLGRGVTAHNHLVRCSWGREQQSDWRPASSTPQKPLARQQCLHVSGAEVT